MVMEGISQALPVVLLLACSKHCVLHCLEHHLLFPHRVLAATLAFSLALAASFNAFVLCCSSRGFRRLPSLDTGNFGSMSGQALRHCDGVAPTDF